MWPCVVGVAISYECGLVLGVWPCAVGVAMCCGCGHLPEHVVTQPFLHFGCCPLESGVLFLGFSDPRTLAGGSQHLE